MLFPFAEHISACGCVMSFCYISHRVSLQIVSTAFGAARSSVLCRKKLLLACQEVAFCVIADCERKALAFPLFSFTKCQCAGVFGFCMMTVRP